jgi:SHS family lactate transporter-like MFS transporter
VQHGFNPITTTTLAVIANVGAICGGTFFGGFSQRIGRRRAIITSALIGILVIPLWAFAPSTALLAVGAFLIQFFVQGAWGVVPVHLNELSPGDVRGTFPGLTYQFGNAVSAFSAQIETNFAKNTFPLPNGTANYGEALAVIMVIVFLVVAGVTALGKERRGVDFASD